MSYFLVYGSEDGTQIVTFDKADELKDVMEDHGITTFRTSLGDADTNMWPEGEALLIKGAVVRPTPKTVVEDWNVP